MKGKSLASAASASVGAWMRDSKTIGLEFFVITFYSSICLIRKAVD
jgi:hypothetical protein